MIILADANERDATKLKKSISEIFTHHEDISKFRNYNY